MPDKVVYLMRGLPSCGKSFTARQLVGDDGVVLETDEFFRTEVGDDPTRYDYREELLPEARLWNLQRFEVALAAGISPIVVDRGNGRNAETHDYARRAVDAGYRIELREPTSPWWQEIRDLLQDKQTNAAGLDDWSGRLAQLSRQTHRVPQATIRRWMQSWRADLTVEGILRVGSARPA
jgi:hypothetical protein